MVHLFCKLRTPFFLINMICRDYQNYQIGIYSGIQLLKVPFELDVVSDVFGFASSYRL